MPLTRNQAAGIFDSQPQGTRNETRDYQNDNERPRKRRRVEVVSPLPTSSQQDARPIVEKVLPEITTPLRDVPGEGWNSSIHQESTVVHHSPKLDNHASPESGTPAKTSSGTLKTLDGANRAAEDVLLQFSRWSFLETKNALAPSSTQRPCFLALSRLLSELRHQSPNNDDIFLSETSLGSDSKSDLSVIRRVNLALFVYATFTHQLSLDLLIAHFIDIFVPLEGRLLKPLGSLLLEYKTHALISVSTSSTNRVVDSLDRIFSDEIEKEIMFRRPNSTSLFPSERDFLRRLRSRRDILSSDINESRVTQWHERYKWDDLLRELHTYVVKNITAHVMRTDSQDPSGGRLVHAKINSPGPPTSSGGQFSIYDPPEQYEQVIDSEAPLLPLTSFAETLPKALEEDFVAKAARAAQIALRGPSDVSGTEDAPVNKPAPARMSPMGGNNSSQHLTQTVFQHYNPSKALPLPRSPNLSTWTSNGDSSIPYPTQSAPTQVLYQRARQNTTSKPNGHTTSTPPPSSASGRRPWNVDEETALMEGLDQVHGPHWSAILSLYGPGGTVNETLKDRNQIQLKDKARNLKLFFLKAGTEVPYYLNQVTGDLSRRLPGKTSQRAQTSDANRFT